MIRPRALRPGNTIAVLSPSWGGPAVFPHIYERGLEILREEFGLRVKEFPTTRMAPAELYAAPQARAGDLNAAFADREVAAIIASIGGDESVRVLPFLDPAVIRANPKILMGYSDTTTLLAYLNQLGLVTFHGPAVMAGFAQTRSLPAAFRTHVRALLFEAPARYRYTPYGSYSEGYPEWGDPANTGLVGEVRLDPLGWRWAQGTGRHEGRLFGGCVEVLEFLKGTVFWPEASFWGGVILFLETSEEAPPPHRVGYMLRNYGMQGVFERLAGLLIGRARGYTAEQKAELEQTAVRIVRDEFGRPDLPIVTNLEFGHTDPQHMMPLGVRMAINCDEGALELLEPACALPGEGS